MKALTTFLFVVIVIPVFSQTRITGKVTDTAGEPIPGANVLIKDSYDGTSSGADGTFSFLSEETGTQTLIITFVGYKPFVQQLELTGKDVTITANLKEEINQLEGVVISAGSFTAGEEKRRTILKPVDIAMTAGATADIAGALNTLPGTQKVGETGRLFVRGGDGSETRTFIDGMVVLDAYGVAAPNTPSRGRFMPFMFKGTSFSTGGYSAEYGQALSSALVLNSKDKAEMNQTDIGILSVGADVAHTQVWDRASVSGKIQYTNVRPYFGLINQVIDWNKAPASWEGSGAWRQQVGKTGMFKLYGNFNQSDFSLYQHEILDQSVKHRFDLTNRFRYLNGAYQQALNESWSVRGGLSYTYNQNDTHTDNVPAAETEKGLHGKLVFEHSVSDQLELRFGSEYFYRDYEASRFNTVSQLHEQVTFTEPLSATFAEAEYYASNKFVVKAGGRFENNSLNDEASVDPRLSVAYKPGKRGQFSLAYGTFRQTAANRFVRFNNQLSPEKAEHYILNYQVVTDRKTFRVETYYKRYDQLTKYADVAGTSFNNNGSGYARGIDVFWRDSQTFKNVDYWVSYSFLDTERDYLSYPHAATPAFASAHNFSFVYKHFVSKIKSQLGFTYSYTSGRPYYNPNRAQENFNTDKTPYYSDLSANVAYLPKSNLIIYLSCTNLLGRDNIFGYEYSTATNAEGAYVSRAIRQAAPRFLFVGVFITITKNKSVNQLPNL
ncbi:MAG: TonB-dependent receptor [Cyclobacteriaceae bacterium]|nr:TonB-dependent receptor [Cyclobacteriaceae bacterium]